MAQFEGMLWYTRMTIVLTHLITRSANFGEYSITENYAYFARAVITNDCSQSDVHCTM